MTISQLDFLLSRQYLRKEDGRSASQLSTYRGQTNEAHLQTQLLEKEDLVEKLRQEVDFYKK